MASKRKTPPAREPAAARAARPRSAEAQRAPTAVGAAQVLQFKVTLEGIAPPIWRRIQVPVVYTFWDLHVAIQDAMGWKDCHLHHFLFHGPAKAPVVRIGIPDNDPLEGDPEVLPGWQHGVSDQLDRPGDRVVYEYDFGDGWEHDLLLEEILPREGRGRYPRCIAGERACPPEDCGGVPGYQNLLEALRDPKHEDRKELLAWVGGSYDPEAFDPRQVKFDDPKRRWKITFGGRRR